MNRATTVPSIADVDPDLVVDGYSRPSFVDREEPAGVASASRAPREGCEVSEPGGDTRTTAGDSLPADESLPPDYVADYDDDQTFGLDEDGVDQRIPFT